MNQPLIHNNKGNILFIFSKKEIIDLLNIYMPSFRLKMWGVDNKNKFY